MMKILLIYPYFIEDRLHIEEIAAVPMGLFNVGAMLKARNHSVRILNWYNMKDRPEAVREALVAFQPHIIGFSIVHANRWGAIDIARLARELDPRVKIVMGGIGATFLWRHLLTHFAEIDYVVVGEGEHAMSSLVEAIEQKAGFSALAAIPGLALRRRNRPVQPSPPQRIHNLDDLPSPARYFDFQHIALTRGCPGRCTFCGSPQFWGRRVRAHSADYFVDQIQMLAERGTTFFYVSDDTFTLKPELVVQVCREIIDRQLKITWQAISKVNAVRADMLYWMRKAGCVQISYGVESGSEDIRRRLCKDIRKDQIVQAFQLTAAHGILPRAYFIYGVPGESPETIAATLALIDRIKPLSAIFYILDIFPGTALYERFKRQAGVDDDIWLERKEDILYFESDPDLNADMVRGFGQQLRAAFHRRLPHYALDIELNEDPSLAAEQADFLSRLALTFSHGDYAGIQTRPSPLQVAEILFERALERHPDHRAYWGMCLLSQRQGRMSRARAFAQAGLEHFPDSPDLNISMAAILMSNHEVDRALDHLKPFENHPQARSLLARCSQLRGNPDRPPNRPLMD